MLQKVNYIAHLNHAFVLMNADDRLSPYHISLYYSLFQYWNISKFRNPISISRDDQMQASKIGSVNTYLRCLKELDHWAYIKYIPSHNPMKGSLVHMFTFDTTTNTTSNTTTDKTSDNGNNNTTGKATETTLKEVLRPSINSLNNTNKQNNKNEYGHTRKKNNQNSDLVIKKLFVNEQERAAKRKKVAPKKEKPIANASQAAASQKSEKSSSKKSSKVSRHGTKTPTEKRTKKISKANATQARFKRPLLLTVKNYFETKKWPSIEAEKFFNYYQGNGWLVGGKTPMQSWQACAANWIINSEKFNNGKEKPTVTERSRSAGKLSATTGKDYSEPL